MSDFPRSFWTLLIVMFLIILTGFVIKRGPGSGGAAGLSVVSKYIENPQNETFESFVHFLTEATATSVWCECRGGTSVIMRWNNNGDNVDGNTVTCTTSGGADDDTELTGSPNFSVGSDLDLVLTGLSGGITDCTFAIYF